MSHRIMVNKFFRYFFLFLPEHTNIYCFLGKLLVLIEVLIIFNVFAGNSRIDYSACNCFSLLTMHQTVLLLYVSIDILYATLLSNY